VGKIDLTGARRQGKLNARWFDPRTGAYRPGPALIRGMNAVRAGGGNWALVVVTGR
jgi:hypothetical protein